MKVLLDIHPSIEEKSGIGRYCDNLARTLIKKENLKLSFYSNLAKAKLPSFYKEGTIFSFPIKHGLVRTLFGLNYAIKRLNPDILHATTLSPFVKKVPTVLTLHDLCFRSHKEAYELKTKLAFSLFLRRSLTNADQIIVPSTAVKKQLVRLFPEVLTKVNVVHEGADASFGFIKNRSLVKKELAFRFDIDRPYFLVVGNIEKRKRPFEIIKAFKKFLKTHKDHLLIFAGADKLGGSVKKRFKNFIKKGQLKLVDYVSDEDLNLLYNGALANIFFSICEGFGLPVLESMVCGTPVICREMPVLREVGAEAAIFCENDKELYLAMKQISMSSSLRNKLRIEGFKRSNLFSWEKAADETIGVYRKVLRQRV